MTPYLTKTKKLTDDSLSENFFTLNFLVFPYYKAVKGYSSILRRVVQSTLGIANTLLLKPNDNFRLIN